MNILFSLKTDTVNTELIKAKALYHLIKELDVGVMDSTSYSENDAHHIFEVENRF